MVRAAAALLVPMSDPSMGFSQRRHSNGMPRAFLRTALRATETPADEASSHSDEGVSASSLPQKVQVCGFKDCRRVGGGTKLENLVNQVLLDEAGEQRNAVEVEVCDCLGECGYGPNLVVDGRIVNGVRGRMAVMQALGMAAVATADKNAENDNVENASPPPSAVASSTLEPVTAASASYKEAA